jgi:hypothetical protein
MMTKDELARLRRQMHRRIRVVLAQRRMTAMSVSLANRDKAQPADEPAGASGEPTPED